jgi:hypothetical protein
MGGIQYYVIFSVLGLHKFSHPPQYVFLKRLPCASKKNTTPSSSVPEYCIGQEFIRNTAQWEITTITTQPKRPCKQFT